MPYLTYSEPIGKAYISYLCILYFVFFSSLDDLHAKDLAKRENEQAKNSLESFLYEFKDKLYSDNVEKLATEEETNKISEKFSEVSDWLMEDGYDATADVSNLQNVFLFINCCFNMNTMGGDSTYVPHQSWEI